MTAQVHDGRANQKRRTRSAIIEAASGLAKSGAEITMPAVAKAALVSEATAYRYFPDLPSLLREALTGAWLATAEALQPIADSDDPVERVGYAATYLLRHVDAYQGAVRAMIAADIIRPGSASVRPGLRFGLIDQALVPLEHSLGQRNPAALESLKRELAIVVSAEAFFTLTDLCGLPPQEAIDRAVHAAQTITAAALSAR